MHANQIHVNTVELVQLQRMELSTSARVCLDIKGTIATKVGIVFLLLIVCFIYLYNTMEVYCFLPKHYMFVNVSFGSVPCNTHQRVSS